MKECLLYSGGVDSYIAREYLLSEGHEFDCLYFNHGGRYTKQELEVIRELPFDVKISGHIKLQDIERPDAYIPNRNILFSVMALSLGYDKIWLGGSKSDRIGDNKPEICNQLSDLMSHVNDTYQKIDSPFYDCYKDDMVKWYVKRYSSFSLVRNTFSCFEPNEFYHESNVVIGGLSTKYKTKECLQCSACFRKCAVLFSGGIFVGLADHSIIRKYLNQFKDCLIETPRSIGTLNYINACMDVKYDC